MLRFQTPPSSVSQECPINETPSRFPNRAPLERVSRAVFYVSLGSPNKSSPDRKISPFSRSTWEMSTPSMFPRTGPLWEMTPVSRALLNISFSVPSKGALPPDSPHKTPVERDALFPEPSVCLSQSLVKDPPSRFPIGAPMEGDARFQRHPSGSPVK
jgi:hypothetical protein